MKRIITVLCIALGLGLVVAVPASAVPPTDCAFSHYHPPGVIDNGLSWSTNDRNAFHTPMYRAGACGKVYIEHLAVYNAPNCAYYKLVTYDENRERNYESQWFRFEGVGDLGNIRAPGRISNARQYRVYTYGCGRYRHPNHPPGFLIFTHGR